ncbi:MAG: GGDEF domain-containing protein [Gammaproteobacteria bacterium]|nr:GGDEF domain-containing protein [Gammaproteobacteria bacterium]
MANRLRKAAKFFTIRKRILIVAIFAALVPSLLLGWISYYQTHEVLHAKAAQELASGLERARRGVDAWLEEKFDGLRVFSGSFVLVENLDRYRRWSPAETAGQKRDRLEAEQQLSEFLQLVQNQVPEYHRLLVLEMSGETVAQFPPLLTPTGIEPGWVDRLEPDRTLISELLAGKASPTPVVSLGVPIVSAAAEVLGLLVAEVPMARLNTVLESSADLESELLLVRNSGEIVLSSLSWKHQQAVGLTLGYQPEDSAVRKRLASHGNYRGVDVISRSFSLPQVPWRLVVEQPYQSVFAEVDRLHDLALLLILILLAGFGLLAYLVSQSILLPLAKLNRAAAAVAKGDLDVHLETDNRDELGFTITIFNDMVRRLRVGREKLEKISITDSLTGLYNRKHIMDTLSLQFSRHRRNSTLFSILMIDVDHFKQINDRLGHPAGDAALQQIGFIFRSVLRNIDVAGRYGGEEFLVILEQAGEQQALETAERIRSVAEQTELLFAGRIIRFTVSIGVASVRDGWEDTPATLMQRADQSLYLAKQRGRNQVLSAGINQIDKMLALPGGRSD